MIKKLTAVILSVVLMLSCVPLVFAESEVQTVSAYEKEIGFLSKIGVLPFEFSGDAPMTRGAFAKMITDLIYNEIDVSATHESTFTDLQYGTDYYNAVAILEGLNVVKGNGKSLFNPNGQILLQDALVIALRLMGYEPLIALNGGYPSGYLYAGKLTGLTREIGEVSALDMKTAAKLIYNMLFVSHMGIDSITTEGVKLGVDYTKNYLSSELNIIKHDVRLVNDGMVSFDNISILDGQVVLEDLSTGEYITAKCDDPSIGDYFGCYLDAYVKYDKETNYAELVWCGIKNNVNIKTIHSSLMINQSLTEIEYETEESDLSGKTKKAVISSANPSIFRNGIRLAQASAADIKPQYGYVKLIDNDGDNAADVVIITDVKSHIIAGVPGKDSLSCKVNPVNALDLDENTVRYRVYKNGKAATLSQIKEDDVVSVAPSEITKSGYQLYTLYASDLKVTGMLNSTDTEEKLLFIGEGEYKVSDLYFKENSDIFRSLVVSENITVYLDDAKNIAFIEGIKANNINLAYLLNVTKKSDFDDVRITLYSKYGAFSNHAVSDNVIIDGKKLDGKAINNTTSVNKFAEIVELLNLRPDDVVHPPLNGNAINPRPAIIKVNTKGQIYYIDTDNRTHDDEALENTDPYVLYAGERYFRTERLYFSTSSSYGTPDGTFLVDNNTLVLQVPDVDRYDIPDDYSAKMMDLFEMPLSDLAGYKLLTYNEMNTYQHYDMQPYNIDPKTGIADFLILRGYNNYGITQTDYSMASSFVVFKKLTQYHDPNKSDKLLHKLYYINLDGTEGSVIVDEEKLPPFYYNIIFGGKHFDKDENDVVVEKLQPGDLIFIGESAKTLESIGRLLNLSDINDAYTTTMTPAFSNTPYKNVYGPASNNTIDVPYDVRRATSIIGYGGTYLFTLASAQSVNGTIVKCALPYTNSTTNPTWAGTFNNYYNDGTDFLTRYIPFDGAAGNILVVEEKKHSPSGNCEIQVRTGSLEDLKTADSFTSDGFRKSSKIFFYTQASVAKNAVIFNLNENHDR